MGQYVAGALKLYATFNAWVPELGIEWNKNFMSQIYFTFFKTQTMEIHPLNILLSEKQY